MTGRTRIAAVGAGALLALGCFTAPAGASDGAHADATVQAETADVVSQTLDLVNQACVDANRVTGVATSGRVSGNQAQTTTKPANPRTASPQKAAPLPRVSLM